jgi:hypothetical protein
LPKNMPLWSLLSGIALIVTLGLVILLTPADKMSDPQFGIFIALIVSTVPSLIGAAYAERTSRDVRNGVVAEKAREGAVQAIEQTQVMTETGPTATAALAATHESTTALAESNVALATLLQRSNPPIDEGVTDHG